MVALRPSSDLINACAPLNHSFLALMRLQLHVQAAAADYFAYSHHLASWGFAVLQYDFNLLAAGRNGLTHTDVAEVRHNHWCHR
jgi:hypothetical protein